MREPFPRVVSRSEMAAVDRSTIDDYGVPGAELMERAGRRVVETINRRWEGLEGLDVAVVRVVAARPTLESTLEVMRACRPSLVTEASA